MSDYCGECGSHGCQICSMCLYKLKESMESRIDKLKGILEKIIEHKFKHQKTCSLETYGYHPTGEPTCTCKLQVFDHESLKFTSIDVILKKLLDDV